MANPRVKTGVNLHTSIHKSALWPTVQINVQLSMQMDTQWAAVHAQSIGKSVYRHSAATYLVVSM